MKQEKSMFDKAILISAFKDSFVKLNPKKQIKNPVMFIVFIGAIITTFITFTQFSGFNFQISIWLWFTILFANFSEAIAEGRGKAQAEALKKMRTNTYANKLVESQKINLDDKSNNQYFANFDISKSTEKVISNVLTPGDIVVCQIGDLIPADGEVIEGIASVDESAITGESAPVIRESGGDRSAVTGGTKVISDRIFVKITSKQGDSFLDKMIALVEGAKRQKTPNEIALTILLSGMTIIFLIAVVTLKPFEIYALKLGNTESNLTIPILISLLVCLIPTTIGGLLSAIGISGIDRLTKRNVIAKSGKAVEAAGDVDVLLLDKTGTITLGNRMATEFVSVSNVNEKILAETAQLSSLSDETPEGRSIVILAKEKFGLRGYDFGADNSSGDEKSKMNFIPFSAQTKMSGVDISENGKTIEIRKGAADSIKKYILQNQGSYPDEINRIVENIAKEGSTPLVVTRDFKVLGVIRLKDIVKGGIKERFEQLRKMGIKTIMITGDNPLTAVAIAAEAGVDDFIAEATPEDKLKRIREEQANGKLVAMIGDGTNDAPALAQADVGVAMNTGTQAAREAGNMVDLDSNPTKLIEVVEIGKQLLMTRGALTTFSISNDIAKYFAILPAIFSTLYMTEAGVGALSKLNIMSLGSPESAILSSVIFNALVIIALIPLALKGVKYQANSASSVLKRNILIYGLGGLIVPFIGIKIIDIIINFLKLV